MTHIQHFQVNDDIELIKKTLERDGCIVIDNALDNAKLGKLKQELQPHLEETPNCSGDFYGYKTKRVSSLVTKSSVCREIVTNDIILEVMDEFLLRNCSDYQLNLTQAIQIGSGEPQQMIHPDDPMFPFQLPNMQEKMINCMWAVDDFTKENGATHLVPGSHKWERNGLLPDRQPKDEEIIQAEMSAGSVLIYFASLLHGGGANKSDKPRTGLVTSYCLGWLRQSENQYLVAPPEVARKYPEKLQKLLGYFVHEPNLGQFEGRDPIELLSDENITNRGFEEFLPEEVKPYLDEWKAHQKAA